MRRTTQQRMNAHEITIAQMNARGQATGVLECPHCRRGVELRLPPPGQTWSSSDPCPYCGGAFFYRINARGYSVQPVPQPVAWPNRSADNARGKIDTSPVRTREAKTPVPNSTLSMENLFK